jgi:hypothetical protein
MFHVEKSINEDETLHCEGSKRIGNKECNKMKSPGI